MELTRRDFVKGGFAAFTLGFVAPALLTEMASAQGVASRNTIILDLDGGMDGLGMLAPYTDPFYYSRRPTISIPAADVFQIGKDTAGNALGLHPRLVGLKSIFDQGKLAILQRVGYANGSRSHFTGLDIWEAADSTAQMRYGWLGRYMDSLAPPLDPLYAWTTTSVTPRTLLAPINRAVTIPAVSSYTYRTYNSSGTEFDLEKGAAVKIASHVPVNRPHLTLVQRTVADALATVDRVQRVGTYTPSTGVTYPNNGFGNALKMIAGAIVQQAGAKLFYVRLGGFDTHARQGTNGGPFYNLMATLDDGLRAIYQDLQNRSVINDTLIMTISEFGRRVGENGGLGSDHGAANPMLILGGSVKGGIYGSAASLNPVASNTTLEASGGDVRPETDFRTMYAAIADQWLRTDSVALLQGNWRNPGLTLVG